MYQGHDGSDYFSHSINCDLGDPMPDRYFLIVRIPHDLAEGVGNGTLIDDIDLVVILFHQVFRQRPCHSCYIVGTVCEDKYGYKDSILISWGYQASHLRVQSATWSF